MKIRRLLTFALLVACVALFAAAHAEESVALDGIGLRYTPAEGELYITRDHIDAQALAALGTDSETMLASMIREGQYLIGIQPDGRQFSLSVTAKPEELTSGEYQELTAADKDAFLTLLARQGGYGNATWANDGYALFTSTAEAQGDGALPYSNLSLATLYLNDLYTFRMDLIGREATQADMDLLTDAASRTLRLGAKAQTAQAEASDATAQTLALPSTAVESQPAALSYQQQGCDLTLDPVADTLSTTSFTLSGQTVASGTLRYSVNGKSSSRIKADTDGRFSFTVPNLTGNETNAIELTAFKGDAKTVVDFSVRVDWQTTPLALETAENVAEDRVTLSGLALPGTTVKLTQGRGSGRITVAGDGTFSVTLLLDRVGSNDFTLQAQAQGYHRNDYAFSVTRVQSDEAALAALQQKVRTVAYQKLVSRPSAYEGDVVQLAGQVSALDYANGSPRFLLTTQAGETYTVLCADLLGITDGQTVQLLGTLGGAAADGNPSPEVTLAALLS